MTKARYPLLFAVVFTLVYWLFQFTFRVEDNQFVIASKLWSDFGAHIPLIRSFSLGSNIPPEYPTFPGEPIRYHFGFYWLVAMLERVGVRIDIALNLISSFGLASLLTILARIADKSSKSFLAGIIAITLWSLNGTLTFLELIKTNQLSIRQILSQTEFASFGPWKNTIVSAFWNLNIYTNQRHLGLSFAIILFLLFPIITYHQKKDHKLGKIYIVFAILMSLVFWITNQAAAAATIVLSVGFMFLNRKAPKNTIMFTVIVMAIIGIGKLLVQTPVFPIIINPGFLAQEKTFIGIAKYWIYNLGVYLPLYIVLSIQEIKSKEWLVVPTIPLFIIANTFQLSPDMINNHKLINITQIFLCIATAKLLTQLIKSKDPKRIVLSSGMFIALTFSGVVDIPPIVNDRHLSVQDIPSNTSAAWISLNTPPNSIFLTSTYLYNPASIAGRKIYLDYGYFNWSLGYDESERRALLPTLFDSQESINRNHLCQLLAEQKIDYVLISSGDHQIGDKSIDESLIKNQFTPIFSSKDGYHIYHVSQNCTKAF